MNLANLLIRAGRAHADRPAIACGANLLASYGAVAARVARLAGGLAGRHRLRPGECVALVMRNCPAYLEAMFACWHTGAVVVPVNARLHPRELAYILGHAGAGICFVSDDEANAVGALMRELPELRAVISVDDREYARLTSADPIACVPRAADDVAWLFYTSGTTGRPKGAMLSHRNLLAMATSYFVDVDHITPDDCILHPAPLSHGSGLYVLPHVAAAAKQVIPESGGFDPDELVALIDAHPNASFFGAPTLVRRLIDCPAAARSDFRTLKTIVYGGAPMYLADCKRALTVLGNRLVQIYGQGESPMTITALSKQRHADTWHPRYDARLVSVGVPHTVVEVITADSDDQPLSTGEAGEVLVRGETVMLGYWRDPQATAEALRSGWLHTGDLGIFDEDGFLTLKDRSKDLIISGGLNIYPREVEEVLLRHPAVTEASVIGAPHAEWGEEVVAFIVAATGPPPDTAELDALCLSELARFKRPRRYEIVAELPKNNYGKVLKRELRLRLAGRNGED